MKRNVGYRPTYLLRRKRNLKKKMAVGKILLLGDKLGQLFAAALLGTWGLSSIRTQAWLHYLIKV